jgi:preprotein translocase subunit SecF
MDKSKNCYNHQPRKKNQMNKILIAYIIGLVVGAGSTLFIVEQLLK